MVRLRAELLQLNSKNSAEFAEVQFSFGLPESMFPPDRGGLQFLVNLLAGDMFPRAVSGCVWSDVEVSSVELPDGVRHSAEQAYRSKTAHTISDIRSLFGLGEGRPLVAFSIKPRVGLTLPEVRRLTISVLNAGFNLVELDARNLATAQGDISEWIEIGQAAAAVGGSKRPTAFAPNLSAPPHHLVEFVEKWITEVGKEGRAVIKIDGGLDGLSGLQAVRSKFMGANSPIVTCFPTLRGQLTSAIGEGTWVDLLALSGADIVYPGGRPTFPNEKRPVWGSHAADWSRAARLYDGLIERSWPMPTVAGGIHPGHLHAFYELFGANVAYFLGGALALHPKSPIEGAKLCVEVLESAMKLAAEAHKAGDDYSEDLPARILKKVEETRYPTTKLNYFSPSNIFGQTDDPPRTFYRR